MANLGPQKQSTSYLGLLQVPGGIDATLKNVTDGLANSTPLQLSLSSIGFSSVTMSGPINMGGYPITNLGGPFTPTDATTKAYVDSIATGLQPKEQCDAATTGNITLSGEQNIDGIDVTAGQRVLVKNQAIQANNGIYIVSAGAWSRSSDADTWSELVNAYVFIYQGDTQSATSWVCNIPGTGTLGSTAITWIKFSSSTSTLANYLTFDALGDGAEGQTDIATELGYNILAENNDFLTIQTPGLINFNGSAPLTISYNSIGAIALDGSNVAHGSTWDISILGNASTVTDGVYTSGTYLNPAWLTGLASSKLIGAVSVDRGGTGATSLSGILLGDGTNPVTTATAADIVGVIGSTPVANATTAVTATTATTATTASVATTTTQINFSALTLNGNTVATVAKSVGYINILDYGAVGDGVTDNLSVFNSAITAASLSGKAIYIPAGAYSLSNTITLSQGITIYGDEPVPTLDCNINPTKGTWLYFNHNNVGIQLTAFAGIRLQSFGTFRPTQTKPVGGTGSYTPVVQSADILANPANAGQASIQLLDLLLLNPYVGIKLQKGPSGGGPGTFVISNLRGQPIYRGIHIDSNYDALHISDVHFWPFWDYSNTSSNYTTLWKYTLNNLQAIRIERADNPLLVNIFTIFANAGLYFASSADGQCNKMHIVNADFDRGYYGIVFAGNLVTGQFDNVTMQGENNTMTPNSIGVYFLGCTENKINFGKLRINSVGQYGIYMTSGSSNNVISVADLFVSGYGQFASAANAVSIDGTNNKARISGVPVIENGGVGTAFYYNSASSAFNGTNWKIYDVTASRTWGTYANTQTIPMTVMITFLIYTGTDNASVRLNNSVGPILGVTGLVASPGQDYGSITFVVPPSSSYYVTNSASRAQILAWIESY